MTTASMSALSSRGGVRSGTGPVQERLHGSGGGTAGSLRRGATGAKSSGSIPTKYETVLHTGAREKDGFGSRTFQRPPASDADLPGE